MINVNASKPRGAFRVFSIIFLAVFSLVSACAPRVAKFGAVVDNGGGVTLNSSGLHMNSKPITNMSDGVASSDGAAFHQIQDALNARTYKGTVRARATGNIASLSGLALTIDTVAIDTPGYHVLVDQQTTTTQDACYVAASGAWTLCPEMAVGTSASNATFVVTGGTQAGVWVDKQTATQTVGTSDLLFTQIASTGGGGSSFPLSGNVSAAGFTIQNLSDPANAQDPMTRAGYDARRNANTNVYWGDDWTSVAVAPTNSQIIPGPGGFLASLTGTGAAIVVTASTSTEVGWLQFKPGTTTTGLAAYSYGTANAPFFFTSGVDVYSTFREQIGQLANGTDNFTFVAGYFDTFTTTPTNAVIFRHANAVTNFEARCIKAGVSTTIDTGVAADTSIHRYEITKAASGNVIFKMDGADVSAGGTALANCPVVGMAAGAFMLNAAGTGAGRSFFSDWHFGNNRYPTPRAN